MQIKKVMKLPHKRQAKTIPKVIVIAIKNIRRGIDFLPHHTSAELDGKQVFGNGGKFLSFVKNELIVFTSKKFRTNGHRVFVRHSWAGQFWSIP
jgi:predicted alpha/beta superfamily hydrolase